ncbi:HsdR family type I site-specific deoxyribonuclease [Serratia fonticola]|uniref:Type I restriction enzyme endonuclease subunit n=1 Tax=Serratia fonticola TaxID=47917 RepID=A0AAJ1YBB7_SERFO|nr:HsdR family type I site-specific deoxyribonuclease [Serratia fonticola]MDQ9126809.1 HsdR family type I site-specific deoxyribonuclease [Serratia fonticola]
MASVYSEDNNIQEPAARIFEDDLDWRTVFAFNSETFGPDSLLGRKEATEVVLVRELDAALARLNPKLAVTPEGRTKLDLARDQLLDADPTKTLLQHNEAKWKLMRDGITLKSPSGNSVEDVHVTVIDFHNPKSNEFLLVRELWVQSGPFRRRCDLVGFVNGLPLVFIELKRHDKGLKSAFDDNYSDYKDTIPHLFHYNALVIVSNGLDARCGSITSSWDHFYRWKRLNEEDSDPAPKHDEPPLKPLLPILLRGVCSKDTLLDLVENFTLFDSSEEHAAKIVARNHQYLGVNKAIDKLVAGDAEVLEGKLGVFWHTQGSGKSYSMVFMCQKIHRKVSASYTFVLLTDRKELDDQIYKTFVGCGVSTSKSDKASGAEGLQRLLRDENRRYVFSLIHKFRIRVTEPWNQRDDVIVISDEAHRTQYGRLALNMRMALQCAKFIGFTGTPLIDDHERSMTEQVFGGYVSVYDFQRAVADGATLPLYYENRGEKLRIIDPDLNTRIEARIDAARADGELSEEQEEKLYRELAREYPVFTSETHLNDVATDFVEHFHQRWRLMESPVKPGNPPNYGGNAKAMLVCIDKLTCAKMAERIKVKWQAKILELQHQLQKEEAYFSSAGKPETAFVSRLRAQILWMIDTQIHPIFSPEQNEVKEFAIEGINVEPYRTVISKGINGKDIDECFKDNNHPFRVAIVCAMWLTGFDVKSLATLYLDKPMKGHTLMQAIARVNRVAANKKNGLIIDYNGMLKSLRKALATYAQGDSGTLTDPLFDEDQALAEYAVAISKVQTHLLSFGYDLNEMIRAEEGEETWDELLIAQNALSKSLESKKTFQVLAEDVFDRFRGLFPNPGVFTYEPQENAISAIYNLLQKPKPKIDISAIMQDIRGVIDASLEVAPKILMNLSAKQYDLSGIDFERLRAEFTKSPYKETAVLTLQERVQARLDLMLMQNPCRIDLYKRYQEIIADYNKDKDDAEIQRVFDDLMTLHDMLDQEEQRYIREGFKTEKELAVFDLLSKDIASITKGDIEKIKKVAEELMNAVETRRQEIGDLRDRASSQAQMKVAIIDHMLEGMPEQFSSEDIEARAEVIYQYYVQTHNLQRVVH